MLDIFPGMLYSIGVAKDSRCSKERKSCRGAPNALIVCVSFCLLAGRHFFIFGGEKYAQRKGS